MDKEYVRGIALFFVGFLLLALYVIAPIGEPLITVFEWRVLTLISFAPSPIIAYIYIVLTGRKEYYIKRNEFNLVTILKEIASILGVKAAEFIKGQISKFLGGLFGF